MQHLQALIILLSFAWGSVAIAAPDHTSDHQHQHQHQNVEPSAALASKRYNAFIEDLSESNVAIVKVLGMVCDFCARGIEKTFKKDQHVRKVDVDLANGQVLIAYSVDKVIDQVEITDKILANGQNVTAVTVVKI